MTVRVRPARADELEAVGDDDQPVGSVTLVPPGAPKQWRDTSPDDAATMRMLAVPSGWGSHARLSSTWRYGLVCC